MNRVALLCLLLAACAPNAKPSVQIVTVKEAVAVPCTVTIPAEPELPDTDAKLAALDAQSDLIDMAKAYRSGRAIRDAFIAEQAAALSACGQ